MSQSHLEILVNATTGTFVARVPDYVAAITVAPETGRIQAVQFRADFASIKTGLAGRDKAMNLWEQTDRFPEVGFTLVLFKPAAGAIYTAQGYLRLHGEEHWVTFPVSVTDGRLLWALDGEAAVDTRDFNLPVIRMFVILKVDPVVRVRFHLQGSVPE